MQMVLSLALSYTSFGVLGENNEEKQIRLYFQHVTEVMCDDVTQHEEI